MSLIYSLIYVIRLLNLFPYKTYYYLLIISEKNYIKNCADN